MDGPEGWSKHAASDESEDNETGTACPDSAESPSELATSESSSQAEASDYKQQDTVKGGSESSTGFLSDSPRKILALNPAPFGSPLVYASYQNKPDFFKGLLVETTRALFDQVVVSAPRLRHLFMTPDVSTEDCNLIDDGSSPKMCQLKKVKDSGLRVDSGKQSNHRGLDLTPFPFSMTEIWIFVGDPMDPNKGIDVYRDRNVETGELEYFVENEDSVYLSINGIRVDSSVRAGPLPSFAVFEFQDFSMFWWQTVTALEYMPVSRLKRKSDNNHEDEHETKKRSSKTVRKTMEFPSGMAPKQSTRQQASQDYDRRLKECERRSHGKHPKITQAHPAHQIPADQNLTDDDVAMAIAAVWYGLILEDSRFAFGDTQLFQITQQYRMYGYGAVCEFQPFVMPLVLNEATWQLMPETEDNMEEDPNPSLPFSAFQRGEETANRENIETANRAKARDPGIKDNPAGSLAVQLAQRENFTGGIGHFLLATAEICPDGRVQITIRDSLPLWETAKPRIRRAARNVVRFSGWLGDEWPQFAPEVWQSVTKQSWGNTCAYHTILNAWAYMLKLPLAVREKELSEGFYRHAKRLFLCAVRGQLDGQTISAFLQHSQYVQSPNLVQSELDVLDRMRSRAMNEHDLTDIIHRMFREQELEYQRVLWEGQLRRYEARWKKSRSTKPISNRKGPTQISSVSGMAPEDVVIAIASIWEGVNRNTAESKRTGRGVVHAYAGCGVLAPSGTGEFQVTGVGVVGRRKDFIIPILNQSAQHFFLATATLAPGYDEKRKSGPCPVTLCIMDSRPTTISRYEMWAQCMSFIHSSGWLGGRTIRPHCDLTAVDFKPVPHQEGIDACGFYVILNAWAHLLGITTHRGVHRRGSTTANVFLSQGLRIVNLALEGFMDSRTIQAYMNAHGYSTSQDPSDPVCAVTDVYAIGLNHEKFERVLQKRHDEERLQEAEAAGLEFPKELYAACRGEEEQLEGDEAWKALVLGGGNVQGAVSWSRARGEREPAEALSPRTPSPPSRSNS